MSRAEGKLWAVLSPAQRGEHRAQGGAGTQ